MWYSGLEFGQEGEEDTHRHDGIRHEEPFLVLCEIGFRPDDVDVGLMTAHGRPERLGSATD